jgi:hypothetical protein
MIATQTTEAHHYSMHVRETTADPNRADGWSVPTIVGIIFGALAIVAAVPGAVLAIQKLRKRGSSTTSEVRPALAT